MGRSNRRKVSPIYASSQACAKVSSKGRGGGRSNQNGDNRVAYVALEKKNELFESYYNQAGILPEDELPIFWEVMRRDLPNSFRFTGSKGHALAVQQKLIDHYIPEISDVEFEGQRVGPPEQVSWFPEKLAWSMTTPKTVVRRFKPFSSFQKFLVSETGVGNISRQEVVSMIPPLLMDVRPGMTVLDMCAAPGSKAAQLVEMVHGGEEARIRKVAHAIDQELGRESSPDGLQVELENDQLEKEGDWSDDGRSTGLLIANDADYRRAHMLVHQVKRLNSPNLIVTNHDAQLFPSIQIPSDTATPRYLKFDRILADVPCSGDGTGRKNYNVWREWGPGSSIGLHPMQVRILVRALQMLKVGGRAVYSTCSLNPLENEAVVATAVQRCGGPSNVRIVDVSKELPGLKRYPGMTSWKIMDKSHRIWSSWEDVEEAQKEKPDDALSNLSPSFFAPQTTGEDRVPVELGMRIYPHFQDTGGFFITVLEKLSEIKAKTEPKKKVDMPDRPQNSTNGTGKVESENEQSKKRARGDDSRDDTAAKKVKTDAEANGKVERAPAHQKTKSNQLRAEPYKYLAADHPELEQIYDFYQVSTRFPRDRFMVRNEMGDPVKSIYYTSTLVRDILTMNEGKGMKFVQAGVRMFMKQDAQGQDICRWRIQIEGMPLLEQWVGEDRIVRLYKRETLQRLLREMFIKVAGGGWTSIPEIGQRVRDIDMGCCVLRVEQSDAEDGFK
jgi:multisite-specific tRNA:(cytosine-C5)-methyltransferase